jgi:hypothetical protein
MIFYPAPWRVPGAGFFRKKDKMKIHLALWQETDTNKIMAVCGVVKTPENFVYPKKTFLAHTEPKDICKTCLKIYNKKQW